MSGLGAERAWRCRLIGNYFRAYSLRDAQGVCVDRMTFSRILDKNYMLLSRGLTIADIKYWWCWWLWGENIKAFRYQFVGLRSRPFFLGMMLLQQDASQDQDFVCDGSYGDAAVVWTVRFTAIVFVHWGGTMVVGVGHQDPISLLWGYPGQCWLPTSLHWG